MVERWLRVLLGRGVPQVVGVYLAASWGLLEFLSWAADRGRLPTAVVDDALVLLLLLVPVVALTAWRVGGVVTADVQPPGPSDDDASAPPGPAPDDAGSPLPPPAASSPPPPARSVAVLPFVDLGEARSDRHLCDGVSEEIITALTRAGRLRVASRTSSFLYREAEEDVREIGRRLGVGAVLEGSVQRVGARLRVTARLVSARDGFELWSERWDAALADVFRIEDEIAGGAARALEVVLSDSAVPDVWRTDVRAYEHYLKGRQYLRQMRRRSLAYAREMFRRAIRLDDGYAPAHAALADSFSVERMYYPTSELDLEEAERASLRALELAPELAEAHAARGMVLFVTGRYDEAERELEHAVELDPQLFDGWYYLARMHFQQGRPARAAELFDRAVELGERHEAAFFAGQSYEAMGDTDAALTRYARALRSVESHMELNPDDARAATIRAVALCRLGRVPEGLEWGARAVEIDPRDGGIRYNVACLHSVAGDREGAIRYLEEAVRVGFGNRQWVERDPDLALVRDDDRVRALLATM